MGACLSGGSKTKLLETSNGDEKAYHKRFLEDQILGEGEFGVVRLVHDITSTQQPPEPLACKVLRKGAVFKNNTLYYPILPHVLLREVQTLRVLAGQHFCLKLHAIFETSRLLYLVTEYCSGGEMMEYLACQTEDLTTEDVSRIAYQLLSAVHHCAQHGVIHRDIKPDNTMFTSKLPRAELRLIDFGSGTIESVPNPAKTDQDRAATMVVSGGQEILSHTTFAGSAFYISPEMFQHLYTQRTDVWSAGATLYVLMAGYPADELQKAFNILQTAKNRNLRSLPNLPDNMPESFYELLEAALVYQHKKRPSAGQLLQYEFVRFWQDLETEEKKEAEEAKDDMVAVLSLAEVSAAAAAASPVIKEGSMRAASVSLRGSVVRHNLFLGFKKYERSLTTVLAALLSKKDLEKLLVLLQERLNDKNATAAAPVDDDAELVNGARESKVLLTHQQKLAVIPVRTLKEMLRNDLKDEGVLQTLGKIPNAALYDDFAYHVALLREFSKEPAAIGSNNNTANMGSAGRRSFSRRDRRSIKRMSSSGNLQALGNANIMTNSNLSYSSTGSAGRRASMFVRRPQPVRNSSLNGGSMFFKPSSMNDKPLSKPNNINNDKPLSKPMDNPLSMNA